MQHSLYHRCSGLEFYPLPGKRGTILSFFLYWCIFQGHWNQGCLWYASSDSDSLPNFHPNPSLRRINRFKGHLWRNQKTLFILHIVIYLQSKPTLESLWFLAGLHGSNLSPQVCPCCTGAEWEKGILYCVLVKIKLTSDIGINCVGRALSNCQFLSSWQQ